ncbi:MAG: hypothetical protein NT092_11815, partial [Bacteroidia bacterium]|nr:hypothetical protein [Bacteroidia bacterium]
KLTFFRNFPDLSFALKDVSVVGTDKFQGDTLAGFKSFDLVFNLASLFSKSGYEVNSVIIDNAVINIIYLKDGTANYDIAKDTTETVVEEADTSASSFKMKLKKVAIINSSVSYTDESSAIAAYLGKLNLNLTGDMYGNQTDLQINLNIGSLNLDMDNIRYLNKAVIDGKIGILADLDKWKFTFGENYLSVNDLMLNFSGMVAMPGDDIETDLKFGTGNTSFKTLLSLIPAVYMTDYKDLAATGEFTLNGTAKGVYSDADSTMPDISIDLAVKNGLISYPALPEKIKNINIKLNAFVDGKDMDGTTAAADLFHLELAGNPFDMTFALKTPVSDPDFKASLIGKIDLTALTKAIPLDSINLSGIIDMSVKMAGRYSMIEKEQYDKFQASGNMGIQNMLVNMTGYPEIKINDAGLEFTPAYAALTNADLNVGGKSDFHISGKLENYLPYVLKNETIKGSLALRSDFVDVTDIMSKMATDTTGTEDTTSLSVIRIPENIDFDVNAVINRFTYDNIKAENFRGHIIIRDGVLSLRETGLNILGGLISLNADYDTRDSLKPVMKANFNIKSIGVKDAFNTFNTIQKLAPAAEGIEGKVNVNLSYQSLLGSDMMPIISSIAGGGKLQSDEITIVKSAAFDKMKEVLKLNEKYTNTLKNLNLSFKLKEGRVYVSPFDTKVGNIKMNISGDQGLDQTMNYIIKTEFPRSELGSSINSMVDNLSALAASYGVAYKPADIMKVNVKLTGVFGKPVIVPIFGGGSGEGDSTKTGTVKETVNQVVSNTVDEGKEKLRKEAEAQGDKLIQEAEVKGQQLRDEAAKAAEKVRQEADIQTQKLVTEAAAKGTIAKLAAQKTADKIKQEAGKKATLLTNEADTQANKIVEEAKVKKQELIDKI